MSANVLLVDWRPDYLQSGDEAASLLLAPAGDATLLEHLRAELAAADPHHALAVVPNFPITDAYRAAIRRCSDEVRILPPAGFGEFLAQHELADWLLILDASHYPVAGFDFRGLLRTTTSCRLVKHVLQMKSSQQGTRERVVFDDEQRVRAIERLYDGVTQLEALGVYGTLLSVAVARHLSNPDIFCLSHLRTQLASCGIASRDIVSSGPALDLKQPEGLLALNERLLQTMPTDGALPGFERIAPTVWAEPGVDVAATSRLIGTVVLHRNVHIRPNAVIVGPVVLAAGVTVGESAIVSRSVVGVDGRVPAAATLVNSVVAADAEAVRDSDVPVGVQWRSELFTPATHTPLTNGNGSAIGAAHTSRGHLLAKRVFDVVVALVALVLLSPIMFATALLVKLTSDGPVFFSHEREGKDGRIFRCCKFRTMVASAHAQQRQLYQQNQVDGPQFKMDRDPRITALGRVLRGTNIDELPQLFNVLRGEMSIIGPRPSPFRENQICVPWRRARLSVRPGITGLWQVCRHDRQVGDFHQWIYFDTLYVRHMSFSLDLKIMLATFLTGGGRWGMPVTWLIPRHRLLEALTPSEWEDAEVQGGFETPAETAPPAEAARQPVAAG